MTHPAAITIRRTVNKPTTLPLRYNRNAAEKPPILAGALMP
jgi:hypothetical protein